MPIDAVEQSDICVVGTGPAAFAFLKALRRLGSDVSLVFLEAATGACPPFTALEPSKSDLSVSRRSRNYVVDGQDAFSGELDGWIARTKSDYLTESRVRAVGGTGNAWTGWICSYLPSDQTTYAFGDWPIPYAALASHYGNVMEALDLPADLLDPEVREVHASMSQLPLRSLEREGWSEAHALVAPFDFRKSFLETIAKDDRARLLTDATVVRLETRSTSGGGVVQECVVRSGKNIEIADRIVRAQIFVLANGALEAPRLMLGSGFGTFLPQLGKNFIEHPYLWDGGKVQIDSARRKIPTQFSPLLTRLTPTLGLIPFIVRAQRPNQDHLPVRLAIGGLGQNPGTINASWETARSVTAYVTLSEDCETDRWGQRRLKLASGSDDVLRLPEAASSIESFARVLRDICGAESVTVANLESTLVLSPAPHRIAPGNHPAGTCRMSQNSNEGVVDVNCRVHSTTNLYIVGSAVFPSLGYANPTLSILALADRLAAHLTSKLRVGS